MDNSPEWVWCNPAGHWLTFDDSGIRTKPSVPYVRADRFEALTAERDALVEKLAEYRDDYGDLPNPAYLRGHNDGRNSKAPTDAEWIAAESVAINAIKAERDTLAEKLAKADAAINRICPYLSASLDDPNCGQDYIDACGQMFDADNILNTEVATWPAEAMRRLADR